MLHEIGKKEFLLPYEQSLPNDDDTVFVFCGKNKREDKAPLKIDGDKVTVPTLSDIKGSNQISDDELQYLFAIDDKKYYLLNNGGEEISIPGFELFTPRTFCDGQVQDEGALAGMTAYHLFFWYRDNKFCGKCGGKTVPFDKERAVRCPECGNLIFPKLMPAVIIAVRNGNDLLITRYKGREYKGIALLAGFCEVGESLEQTVAREIKEEVGLDVENITYFASQPWGIDSNLLAGFYADVKGDPTIHRDENELSEAVWVPREELEERDHLMSLTRTLIEAFRVGKI